MSVHVEHYGVESITINYVRKGYVANYDTYDEDDELATSGPALVLGDSGSLAVIEAEQLDQLVEFARTVLRMAETAESEGTA